MARRGAAPLAHTGSRNANRALVFLLFQASLCAFIQEKEFCTMVSTTELQKTTGTVRFKSQTARLWVELIGKALAKQIEGSAISRNSQT